MEIISYIVFSISGIYFLIIFFFFIGWKKLPQAKGAGLHDAVDISLVIACRNEEKNLPGLLHKIVSQDYPMQKLEVILVNDHSTDKTFEKIHDFIKNYPHIKLLNLAEGKAGKKQALTLGIEKASHAVIITTDADCTPNPQWISSMAHYYVKHKPKLLSGPVVFNKPKNLFQGLQQLEFISLVASGAGAIGINKPIMCNGANLLFEKESFEKSNLQNQYASGDDIFLMLQAKNRDKKSIHFIKSNDAIVYTNPSFSFKSFLSQRLRWASKSKAYRDFDIVFTAIAVFLINLSLIAALTLSAFNKLYLKIFILLFIIKSIADLLLLIPTCRFFKQQKILWLFLPLQIIYPFYILISAVGGWFGNFGWKGRKFQ